MDRNLRKPPFPIASKPLAKYFTELNLFLIIVGTFLLGLFRILLWKRNGFTNDAEIWYGIYHYCGESLSRGRLPLWNPYMDGGEPFWPFIGIVRALDPLNLVFIFLSRLKIGSLYYLYHLNYLLTLGLISFGLYLLLRYVQQENRWNKQLNPSNPVFFGNLLLFAFFFHHVLKEDFNAPSVTNTLSWTPYLLLFTLRFMDKKNIRDFLLAVYFLGLIIAPSSYHFAYPVLYFLIFSLSAAWMNRKTFFPGFMEFLKKQKWAVLLALAYLVCMMLPIAATGIESSQNVYPIARTWFQREVFESSQKFDLSYENMMRAGAFVQTQKAGFWYVASYPGYNNRWGYPKVNRWKMFFDPRELAKGFMLLFFLIGVLFGKGKWKGPFLITLIVTYFAMLGPSSFKMLFHGHAYVPHELMTIIFPPLKYTRHTVMFLAFFFVGESYLVSIGVNALAVWLKGKSRYLSFALCFLLATFLGKMIENKTFYGYEQSILAPDFNQKGGKIPFAEKREFALPRTGWYLLDPMLYKKDSALNMLVSPPKGVEKEAYPYKKAWDEVWQKWRAEKHEETRWPPAFGIREHAWTRLYHEIYLLGERNIDVFKALMGVDENVIDFKGKVLVMTDRETESLTKAVSGKNFKDILKKAVIVDRAAPEVNACEVKDAKSLIGTPSEAIKFSYRLTHYDPAHIHMMVKTDKDGVLLFRDGYHQDWHASVDGAVASILRANVGFKGVYLKAGEHKVIFKYVPVLFIVAFFATVFWSFAMPVFIFLLSRHARRTT